MKNTKKVVLMALATLCLSGSLSSCATLFGGHVTEYQRLKPTAGQPQRQVRPVALIADILFWPSLFVDFGTGAIYKPQPETGMATPAQASTIK